MYFTKYFIEHTKKSGDKRLLNTLTGEIIDISEKHIEAMKKLQENNSFPIDPDIENDFKRKGFIYESVNKELELVENMANEAFNSMKKRPLTFFVHISNNCNLNCDYCNYASIEHTHDVMTQEDIDKVFLAIEKIYTENDAEKATIVLFGGEPFVKENYGIIEYFMEGYRALVENGSKTEKRYSLLAFSNGVDLPYYKEFLEVNKRNIDYLFVTLNGPKEIHNKSRVFSDGSGSFDYTVEGINTLINLSIPMWLVVNTDRKNIQYLPFISRIISEKEWDKKTSFMGCCVSRVKNRYMTVENSMTEDQMIEEIMSMVADNKIQTNKFNFEDMRLLKNVMNFFDFSDKKTKFGEEDVRQHITGCGNRSNQYSFTVDGHIYPCSPAAGNTKYAIGRYKPEIEIKIPKEKCWNSRSVLELESCRQCKALFICGGGCAFEATERNGSEYVPVCPNTEKIIHAYLDSIENNTGLIHRETVYK
ncbi:radical SAM protein with 4Fe4S-binding SPASM domain [Ruminiclostridium sufflavum DSM 19573]|uniref:Radical SAM protein with 4Fe4S-binding SPASM domain n=1 Tax=Ruminiclostridium sufflavum DSM 19573 TaxID=1121337 RepID=A0A318XPK7_9FIRM|nr:SPASM domain-containing protein [Ruminiclostridium sufflavum]PYG88022.1 radical SAM protein with 4Fe4S-binding SPASM domain [Ruminiclostridium sufflavum DSM 19573]